MSEEAKRIAICHQVAELLKGERLRQKLSMNQLAIRAGLSQQSVSYVERHMRIPNLDTLLRITGALDIDFSVLLAKAVKLSGQVASKTR